MELQISMIPSPEDPPLRSDDYQSELRDFGSTLRAKGLDIHDVGVHGVREGCPPPILGEWRIKLGATVAPILGTPVGSWLQARHGRTARLKIGEIEADIRTVEELVTVIQIANCYQDVMETDE